MKSKSQDGGGVSINIAALKAELARYLRLVEAGQEVVVFHHKTAIAKIIPFSPEPRLSSLESIKPKGKFSEITKMKFPRRRRGVKKDSLTLLLEERGAN